MLGISKLVIRPDHKFLEDFRCNNTLQYFERNNKSWNSVQIITDYKKKAKKKFNRHIGFFRLLSENMKSSQFYSRKWILFVLFNKIFVCVSNCCKNIELLELALFNVATEDLRPFSLYLSLWFFCFTPLKKQMIKNKLMIVK